MTNTYPSPGNLQDVILPGGQLVDVSSASLSYAPVPFAGVIVDAFATISAAVTSANSVVTVKVFRGSALASTTIGTITIANSGSAPGSTFAMAITGSEADRSVGRGDVVVFDSDGASSTTSIANFAAVLRRT